MPSLRSGRPLRPARPRLAPFAVAAALCLGVLVPSDAVRAVPAAAYCADGEESAFLGLINGYRAQNGLGPLALSATLGAAADTHSEEMAANDYFSHTMLGGVSVLDNIRAHGYPDPTYAENIAAGPETAAGALQMWQNSPGHNAAMLGGQYGAIGIGRAAGGGYGWYWTAIFGGSLDTAGAACGAASAPPLPVAPDEPAEVAPVVEPTGVPTPAPAAPPAAAPTAPLGLATATAALSLRAGPGPEFAILTTVPSAATVSVTGAAQAGYLPVDYAGQSGWVAAEFLAFDQTAVGFAPAPEMSATAPPVGWTASTVALTAVADLTLRAGPSFEAEVLAVVPAGATVVPTGEQSGGFVGVTFGGDLGWADAASLA